MQRWTALLFLVAVLGLSAFTVHSMRSGSEAASAALPDAGAGDAGAPDATDDGGEADAADSALALENVPEVDAGGTLLSGEAAPSLGNEAPKSVVFGAVLIQYRGAQGAAPTARSREAALALAKDIAVLAKEDFKAAVAKGDRGSTENAGRLPRGMIEPAPEYVLFSLPKGAVSDPVDTPRGFWIVRRIE